MKMNRLEWIIVILCGLGLAYVLTTQKPAPRAVSGPTPATSVVPSNPGAPQADTPPLEPATPVTPAVAEVENVLKNAAVEATFTNIGGGMKLVKILAGPYAGATEQVINNDAKSPIGALMRGSGNLETTAYTASNITPTSITYTATAGGVEITKVWTMVDGKPSDGWGYLWDLNVTLRNTGAEKLPVTYSLYSGVLGALHSIDRPTEIASSWYADGDADVITADKFDASSIL